MHRFDVALIAVLCLPPSVVQQAETREFDEIVVDGNRVPFAYHLPAGYEASRAYPVLLGPGDARPGSESGFFWRDGIGDAEWIVVETPGLYSGREIDNVRALFAAMRERVRVDGDRFYLTAWSAGSPTAFRIAAALADEIHALIVIPGSASRLDDASLAGIPYVLNIVGANDAGWLRWANDVQERRKRLGAAGEVDVVDGGGHVLVEIRGQPFLQRLDQLHDRLWRERGDVR